MQEMFPSVSFKYTNKDSTSTTNRHPSTYPIILFVTRMLENKVSFVTAERKFDRITFSIDFFLSLKTSTCVCEIKVFLHSHHPHAFSHLQKWLKKMWNVCGVMTFLHAIIYEELTCKLLIWHNNLLIKNWNDGKLKDDCLENIKLNCKIV